MTDDNKRAESAHAHDDHEMIDEMGRGASQSVSRMSRGFRSGSVHGRNTPTAPEPGACSCRDGSGNRSTR